MRTIGLWAICGLILPLAGCSHLKARSTPKDPNILQFRLVEEEGRADAEPVKIRGREATCCVSKQVLMDARDVKSAHVTRGAGGKRQVSLTFTEPGFRKLVEITGRNVGRRLAILVEGQVLAAPTIHTVIDVNHAVIVGDFSPEELRAIARAINAAAR
ncbi:MAG TPA: hypothetical protein PLE19_19275 [Planctomycetota bacterium]|nr:hypothetical protein [Planctomycetota bacterium]HRR82206.1 hypothetical protein [Planctomycetota bacterium]HRT96353.1 hypothetical protein [Planctomycetota bacterium]